MRSYLQVVSGLQPKVRRAVIMIQDVVMVLIAVALSLLLSLSRLSFEPFSVEGLAVWTCVVLFSHFLFRSCGLYNTVWRFASTPDFFNILKSCAIMTVTLYGAAILFRHFKPVTGLNERQFIVFFLVAFTTISAPRLFYRFLREGASWRILSNRMARKPSKQALFVGKLSEADLIIRFTRSEEPSEYSIVGIMAIEDTAPLGTRIQGVPVVAIRPRMSVVLEEYTRGTKSIELLIFGNGAEDQKEEFSELVRVARQNEIAVVQFSGFSQFGQEGKLILDSVKMETILRREMVPSDVERITTFIRGKRILVTGGAGSIGRVLVKRALELGAEGVLVADISEFGIFRLNEDVDEADHARLTCRIVDVRDRAQMTRVVRAFEPHIIFHAAALKHVPLLEENWESAVEINVFGTLVCAQVAADCGVPEFVLISSDKAVDPTSVLGATKLAAEEIVSSLHAKAKTARDGGLPTIFISVRFGNVFGSDGSVATIFQKQIEAGGPVTITDSRMTRYFMTIAEAVDLVIMSASDAGDRIGEEDYGVYMLDMGKPVPILEVAETMIRMAGKVPYSEIPIRFTGIRPGEKLHETLHADDEEVVSLGVSKVFGLRTSVADWSDIDTRLEALRVALKSQDKMNTIDVLHDLHARAKSLDNSPVKVQLRAG